jgi:GNAT superfamily N-acetyltransferase
MDSGLYAVQAADIPRARDALVDAFSADPLWAAVFAGEREEQRKRQAFFEVPVVYCRRYGQVVATSPACEAVAAWMPGQYSDMGLWHLWRSGGIWPGLRLGPSLGRKLAFSFAGLGRDRARHMRGRPYVYLQAIGAIRARQGQGLGGRLLRSLFACCDRAGLELYLETETEENVALYEHLGFETLDRIVLPGLDLPMWELRRGPGPRP